VLVVLSPQQKATVDFLDCGVHPSQALPGRFRVGAGMRCTVLATDGELPQLALSSTISGSELAVGSTVTARVTAVEGSSLRLRLPRGLNGVVPGAPALAIGQYVECKVTGVRRGEPLTLALLDAAAAEAAADGVDTHVAQGAADALANGDLVDAVVVRVDDGGVYVRIADSIDGFSPAREAADDRLNDNQLAAAFPSGTTVRARVLTINRSAAQATVALKRSSVAGTTFLRFEDLKRGLLVHGRVASVTDYGVFVALDFSDNLLGLCHARNLSDSERFTPEQMRERFTRGSSYHCVVTQVREQDRKFALALKDSLVGPALAAARASGQLLAEDEDAQGGTFVAHDESDDDNDSDSGNDGDDVDVDAINAKRARHDADDDDDDEDEDDKASARESRPRKVSVGELDSMLARTSASFDDTERLLMVPRSSKRGSAAGGVGVSFDDIDADVAATSSTTATTAAAAKKRAIAEAASNGDTPLADDAEARKRPRNVQAASLRREEEVLARERELADGTAQVLTETDHERAVTLEPSSARAWISFMSFHAANSGIEAARAVSARALKSIPMSKEAVRLDVWLALLALELNFGDAESLDEAFKRAARQNDAETVHVRMAALYERAERPADAVGVLQAASKKFANSLAVWEALGRLQLAAATTTASTQRCSAQWRRWRRAIS
jgi:rRNA biogenesis protein RRP5